MSKSAAPYEQTSTAPGSDLYYSLLFIPVWQRAAITKLLALRSEFAQLESQATDLSVKEQQLAWWRSEVNKLHGGSPSHPASIAVAPVVSAFRLPAELFQEWFEASQMLVPVPRFPDEKTFDLYCQRSLGSLFALIAEIAGCQNHQTFKSIQALGRALRLSELIRSVGKDSREGRIYFSVEMLQAADVPAEDILACRDSAKIERLIEEQIRVVQLKISQALSSIPETDQSRLRFCITLARIHQAVLNEIHRGGCKVMQQQTELTPLRKFWIALHTRWHT